MRTDKIDVIEEPFPNPANWPWTVRRNGRPVWHWEDRRDAELMAGMIRAGLDFGTAKLIINVASIRSK